MRGEVIGQATLILSPLPEGLRLRIASVGVDCEGCGMSQDITHQVHLVPFGARGAECAWWIHLCPECAARMERALKALHGRRQCAAGRER